jgi:catechol 2,3-dioxygenase-like lactoylglutathione lyase family enzyme
MTTTFLTLFLAGLSLQPPTSADVLPTLQPYLLGMSVADVDRSVKWYETTLGFETYKRMELPKYGLRIAFMKRGSMRLELIQKEGSAPLEKQIPGMKDHTMAHGLKKFALVVPDLAAVEKVLRSRGARFTVEPFEDKEMKLKSFLVSDPDGNPVQFVQELP